MKSLARFCLWVDQTFGHPITYATHPLLRPMPDILRDLCYRYCCWAADFHFKHCLEEWTVFEDVE